MGGGRAGVERLEREEGGRRAGTEMREGGGRAGTETVERGGREEEVPEQRLDRGAERQRDNQDNTEIT